MRWQNCIALRGNEASSFVTLHFGEPQRKVLLIAGAGFDPRALKFPNLISAAAKDRLRAFLIIEERPEPGDDLVRRADANLESLKIAIANNTVCGIEVFSDDLSVTGVRDAVRQVSSTLDEGYTDVIIDQSALSIGIGFPIIRAVLTHKAVVEGSMNVHAVVAYMPDLDQAVRSKPVDKARDVVGFKGGLGLSRNEGAAKLWLPQLTPEHNFQLDLLHQAIRPHDTCPILPFPSNSPRASDDLTAEYAEMLTVWQVSDGNLIYAAENNPLDLYRTILRIDTERRQVFEHTGGSLVVLSPAGSKALALGALMAAVERDLPMMYIESLGYDVDWESISGMSADSAELIHLWLAGEPYQIN